MNNEEVHILKNAFEERDKEHHDFREKLISFLEKQQKQVNEQADLIKDLQDSVTDIILTNTESKL